MCKVPKNKFNDGTKPLKRKLLNLIKKHKT